MSENYSPRNSHIVMFLFVLPVHVLIRGWQECFRQNSWFRVECYSIIIPRKLNILGRWVLIYKLDNIWEYSTNRHYSSSLPFFRLLFFHHFQGCTPSTRVQTVLLIFTSGQECPSLHCNDPLAPRSIDWNLGDHKDTEGGPLFITIFVVL